MLDPRIAELIQADVDGELPASDRAELEKHLERSEAARNFRDEMQRIARLMAELPDVDPPPGLVSRILDRVRLPVRPRAFRRRFVGFRPATYGLAMAAGVLLAIGISRLPSTGPADFNSLVGSMVQRGTERSRPVAGRLTIGEPDVSGSVLLKDLDGKGSVWVMEVDLDSGVPVELRVDLASAGLGFGGLADQSAGLEIIEISGGNVRMMSEGHHQFVLFLRVPEGSAMAGDKIGITVSSGGVVRLHGSLVPEDKPGSGS